MVSWASSDGVRRSMRSNRRRDTRPEVALRQEVHRLGLRYFVDRAPLRDLARRRADLVFPRLKVAVYLDGCFWHGCPEHHTVSKTNAEFWATKVEKNRARDEDTNRRLEDAGWTVIRVWEHEDPAVAAAAIRDVVEQAKRGRAQNR
ncbi:very short patch repair endonuclease [Tsukamurella paurometabola]|uniref:Very short patch repair endonuclease n=1 Tax=Tsukamurella paurometabola TaxID=2061 RepID=A0ABS5NI27_TSUPA|nr:very short patch repair endonuclease [Tsukamurella paurometabola]MBS4103920.1 very short patch repair endonuclease [Tsukamurella paurometabola]